MCDLGEFTVLRLSSIASKNYLDFFIQKNYEYIPFKMLYIIIRSIFYFRHYLASFEMFLTNSFSRHILHNYVILSLKTRLNYTSKS